MALLLALEHLKLLLPGAKAALLDAHFDSTLGSPRLASGCEVM